MITITVDQDEINRTLGGVLDRLSNPRPGLKAIGEILRASIRDNFRAGGRPTPWQPSKRATGQRGQTLRDTNRLYNSLTIMVGRDRVQVGTNVDYAAAHHFGVNKTISQQVRAHDRLISQAFGKPLKNGATKSRVKAHARQMTMRLVARPFMLVQPEDWQDMTEALGAFIIRGQQ